MVRFSFTKDENGRVEGRVALPRDYSELTDEEMSYFAILFTSGFRLDEAKAAYLVRVIGREAVHRLDQRDIAFALSSLDFLDTPPLTPLRPSTILGVKALPANFDMVDFSTYIRCENLYQRIIQNPLPLARMVEKMEEVHRDFVCTLYEDLPATKVEAWHVYICVQWWGGLKRFFARLFPHLFRPAQGGDGAVLDLRARMDAQIRALTGGDITKEMWVLKAQTLRALTELDAKAAEAEQTNHKK